MNYGFRDSDLKKFEENLFQGFCKEIDKYNSLRDANLAYLRKFDKSIDNVYKKQFFDNVWELIQTNIKFASLNN